MVAAVPGADLEIMMTRDELEAMVAQLCTRTAYESLADYRSRVKATTDALLAAHDAAVQASWEAATEAKSLDHAHAKIAALKLTVKA